MSGGAAQRSTPTPLRRRLPLLTGAAFVVLGVVLLRVFVLAPVRLESASMLPTYAPGDVVLVTRTPPALEDVRRGDLVTFTSPEDGRAALKRVVGLPGEEVVILDGVLYVDDAVVPEPYVDHDLVDGYFSATFVVPDAAVFVLGDNRGNSVDSRDYGAVPVRDLRGSMVVRVWPLSG